jgi:hypothetical protein
VTDRELTLAKNEALFRGVNERVREVKGDLGDGDPESKIEFICECGRSDCVDHVTLTVAEYEAVRAKETHFLLKPGHEAVEVEDVVWAGDRYVVVEKHSGEGAVARETEPRA